MHDNVNQTETVPMHSEKIELLVSALAKAQATMAPPKKDSINPHFKSSYADLASDWDACRKPLTDNGLCVVQTTHQFSTGAMMLRTWLFHSSGQFIFGDYLLSPQKNDPQGMKSAVTYARRTALEAIIGLAPDDDDDGNASTSRTLTSPPRQEGKAIASGGTKDERPPQADYAQTRVGWEKEPCTEPQRKKLWAMAKEAGYDEMHLKDVVLSMTNKESTKDLTKGEIQQLFKEFEELTKKPA